VTAVKLRSLMLNLPENYTGDPLKFDSAVKIQKALAEGKDFVELVKSYSAASNASQTAGVLPPRSVGDLPTELRQKLANLKLNDVVGPLHIGRALFFFQYIGSEFGSGSDLKANYTSWKNKLLNIKYDERLTEYLKNERTILRVNMRPFHITR
ncbi:MAG: peptidylprolyl isomerase, partial [Bdellovibrionota bacterium]